MKIQLIGGDEGGKWIEVPNSLPMVVMVSIPNKIGMLAAYDYNEDEDIVLYKFRKNYITTNAFQITDNEFPDHVDIDMKYYPDGVGPGGFSPATMKARADMFQRGTMHDMDGIKSWVIIWLLDHIDWDRVVTEEINMKADGRGDHLGEQ